MLATTKQVREIGKSIVGFGAQWTDETSKYDKQRRSVVWALYWQNTEMAAEKLEAELKKRGFSNKVKVTKNCYLRVIANLA